MLMCVSEGGGVGAVMYVRAGEWGAGWGGREEEEEEEFIQNRTRARRDS